MYKDVFDKGKTSVQLLSTACECVVSRKLRQSIIIMHRCACASEVYGSVFVCDSCSRINEL